MKFNEKLIELRKKEGLSQEELGYKLNVTRQTISKWELGQTTPEMEKLSEIGNIFGISVDNLINEAEEIKTEKAEAQIIEDQPIQSSNPKNSKISFILITAIVILLVCGVISIFNKITTKDSNKQSLFDKIFNNMYIYDQEPHIQEDVIEDVQGVFEGAQEIINNTTSEMNKTTFNGILNGYNGTKSGYQVERLLDDVITSNKTKERKITIKYLEIETQDTDEIKNLKTDIEESKNFEVSFEYDEDGYIYEVIIERVITESEIKSFNNSFEFWAGTTWGTAVKNVMDKIITNNKTEELKITVKFNGTETQDENQIRNMKQNISTSADYELTFEYDEDGFINKAIIEKI
jgi:transcriptional regulator with XRE-family HTH domain